jgi:F-type H+-transporting ATPase subunit b
MLLAAGLAPSAINVDVDLTFLVQLVLFVGLTLVLKPVLFDPMLKLFEERERRTEGVWPVIRSLQKEAGEADTKYSAAMEKVRAEAGAERDKIRAEGVRREQEILGEVRAAAGRTIEDGKRNAQAEADRTRAALKAEAAAVARDLAGRVLGREVQP